MNNDRAAGQWKQLKGSIKEQWGKLTDDEISQLEGHGDQLAGRLQERYGLAREEAERQAREFQTRHNWH
ncbi:MAG TPA: CsbD family protein [Steroidobacteraceae bacterium]|nr:CsbD family protein [Steroidobacteraceae bacterium]